MNSIRPIKYLNLLCYYILLISMISGLIFQSRPLLNINIQGIRFPAMMASYPVHDDDSLLTLWAPYPFDGDIDFKESSQPPSTKHWLGTDIAGRDLLAYSLKAIRQDTLIGVLLTLSNMVIGSIIATYWVLSKRSTRSILTTFMVSLKSIPKILIILISIQSPHSLYNFIILSCLTQWAKFSLIIRTALNQELSKPHCIDAQINQHALFSLIRWHLFPAIEVYIRSTFAYGVMQAVSALAALRFLGYGFNHNSPTLGNLLLYQKNHPNLTTLLLCLACYSIIYRGLVVLKKGA